MSAAIRDIDWDAARPDVQRFLPVREQESLGEWTTKFFLYQTDLMKQYLASSQ